MTSKVWGAPTALRWHTQPRRAKAAVGMSLKTRLNVWKSRCTMDVLVAKCLLQLREQFMTFILLLSAHPYGGQARMPWAGPPVLPLAIIAQGALELGWREPFLKSSFTGQQQQKVEALRTRDQFLPPPPSVSLIFANYLSYLCSIPHL